MKIWRGKRNRKETKKNSHTHTHTQIQQQKQKIRKMGIWNWKETEIWNIVLLLNLFNFIWFHCSVKIWSVFKNTVLCIWFPRVVLLLKSVEILLFCWICYCCNCWNLLLLPSFSGTCLLNFMLERDSTWLINEAWIAILFSICPSLISLNFIFVSC